MFIKVNDLGEGVIDRISTLTPEQKEAVMDSGMKIHKATNPSGVAMKRITDAIRSHPSRSGRKINLRGRQSLRRDERNPNHIPLNRRLDPGGLFDDVQSDSPSRSRSQKKTRG